MHHGAGFRHAVGEAHADYVTDENSWMSGITYGKPEVFEEVLRRSGIQLQDSPLASIHTCAFEAMQAAVEELESALAPIVISVLGGVGHVWGPMVGAFFITLVGSCCGRGCLTGT